MSAIGTVIKDHLKSVMPALEMFVEVSSVDYENNEFYEPDLDDEFDDNVNFNDKTDTNHDDFFKDGQAINMLIKQDEYYPMARPAIFVSCIGDKRKNRKLKDWDLVEEVTDLYVQIRKMLKSSNPDPEKVESLLAQLKPLVEQL